MSLNLKVSLAALILFLGGAGAAGAADTTAAKKRATALLQEGARLLDDKDFSAALQKFVDAYRLVASAKIQFNIGLAQEGLDRPAEAIHAYRIYIEEATADSASRRADARVRIDALRPHVTQLSIISTVPGAVVLIDGVEEGRTPMSRPLVVNPGPHQVVVQFQSAGEPPWTQVIRGEPGAKVELQVSKPSPPPTSTTPPQQTPPMLVGKAPDPAASPEPTVLLLTTPAAADPPVAETPFYKRAWFWGVVAGVVAAGTVGVVLATRGGGSTGYPCDFQTTCLGGAK
ncbi:MAG TPA: PEGA domain-containing protein [Polyangia bacterium]|nr:PEGA domain-containing protein [Polyangia bacterium]